MLERPRFVRGLGPGLVSGASANDPTTVGSLAVVGAGTGYGLAWLVVLLLPMLALVQAIAASVAAVSHMSLQQAIARSYGRVPAVVGAVAIVAVALATLTADIQAGAQALTLLSGVPFYYFVLPLAAIAYWLLATKSYLRIERILAWLTLIFLCYVASAILAHPDWHEVLRGIFLPRFSLSPGFATGAIALLGTTLTGYVYFWESIEVAERRPKPSQLRAVNADAVLGMLVAGSTFLFILVAAAATSGRHHMPIRTAVDAAVALQPLAGSFAQMLFGIGLLASAAIAVPVIAATNGYVVAQTLRLPASLALKPREAPMFYRVVFASLAISATLALLPIPTMLLLYWVSVIAGLATPITLGFATLVARNPKTMRGRPIGVPLACAGWAVTGVVTLSSLAFILSAIHR
ncbi:MAG: divalent metal cation transporter [Candidatus Eremiobacteraeota bacterium]|nr:divalent metal cation transporter [Candidatus Eremiobacteraeota bacterium]